MAKGQELERVVGTHARRLREAVEDLPSDATEADLRHRVEPILNGFCRAAGVKPTVRDEYVVAEGGRDQALRGHPRRQLWGLTPKEVAVMQQSTERSKELRGSPSKAA